MLTSKLSLGTLALTFLLTGCVTSSNIQLVDTVAFDINFKISNVTIKNNTGQTFDIDIAAMLSQAAKAELMKKDIYLEDTLAYSFNISIVQYEKGNAFARWMLPGMGKTILSVEANMKNKNGEIVAQSQATRSIGAGGGYTIGAWKKVFQDVSETLVSDLLSVR